MKNYLFLLSAMTLVFVFINKPMLSNGYKIATVKGIHKNSGALILLDTLSRGPAKDCRNTFRGMLLRDGFAGKDFRYQVCINQRGNVVFAEFLPDSTLSLPLRLQKTYLRHLYTCQYDMDLAAPNEECGLVIMD